MSQKRGEEYISRLTLPQTLKCNISSNWIKSARRREKVILELKSCCNHLLIKRAKITSLGEARGRGRNEGEKEILSFFFLFLSCLWSSFSYLTVLKNVCLTFKCYFLPLLTIFLHSFIILFYPFFFFLFFFYIPFFTSFFCLFFFFFFLLFRIFFSLLFNLFSFISLFLFCSH